MVRSGKACMHILVGHNTVCILFGGKRVDQDGIAAMEGNHDVLVSTAGMGFEATSISGENVVEVDFVELDHIGAEGWGDVW